MCFSCFTYYYTINVLCSFLFSFLLHRTLSAKQSPSASSVSGYEQSQVSFIWHSRLQKSSPNCHLVEVSVHFKNFVYVFKPELLDSVLVGSEKCMLLCHMLSLALSRPSLKAWTLWSVFWPYYKSFTLMFLSSSDNSLPPPVWGGLGDGGARYLFFCLWFRKLGSTAGSLNCSAFLI